jgi:hypothetical protein
MLWNKLKMSQLLKENMINCSFLSEDFSYETGVENPCRTVGLPDSRIYREDW